jgi:hypothetical protein
MCFICYLKTIDFDIESLKHINLDTKNLSLSGTVTIINLNDETRHTLQIFQNSETVIEAQRIFKNKLFRRKIESRLRIKELVYDDVICKDVAGIIISY